MTNTDSTSTTKSETLHNGKNYSTRSLLFVSIFTLLLIGVLTSALFLFNNNKEPEKVAETFFMSSIELNMENLKNNSAFDLDKLINDWTNCLIKENNYKNEEDLFSNYSAFEGIKISNINDLINFYKSKFNASLKRSYGDNYKILFYTVECTDLTDEEIAKIKETSKKTISSINKNFKCEDYINFDNATDYKKVVFDATISGNKTQTSRSTMYLVKIDNSWKSLDLELISTLF